MDNQTLKDEYDNKAPQLEPSYKKYYVPLILTLGIGGYLYYYTDKYNKNNIDDYYYITHGAW